MNGLIDQAMNYLADAIRGTDGDIANSITVTNDTVFTANHTGWLVCTLTTNSGQTVAPYAALESYKANGTTQTGLVSSIWGITSNGATLSVQGPVKKGCKYRVHAVRCSIASTRIYT